MNDNIEVSEQLGNTGIIILILHATKVQEAKLLRFLLFRFLKMIYSKLSQIVWGHTAILDLRFPTPS